MMEVIGKVASFLCSLSVGFSASGFILELSSQQGFNSNSPIWLQGLVYGGAAIIGINAAYRIWRVARTGVPNGLQLIFGKKIDTKNSVQAGLEVSIKKKPLEIIGVILSVSAGTTYGGLAYLGISNIVKLQALWWNVCSGVVIISSNSVAAGALFSYAWLQNLRNNTLFSRQLDTNCRSLEVCSSGIAIFGLGCTMTIGSFGLAKSMAKLPNVSTPLGIVIAILGFLGEVPFAVKQGRLLVFKISKICSSSTSFDQPISDTEVTNFSCSKTASILMYISNSSCGTYAALNTFSIPLRVTFALGSGYLSLVGCLEEPEKVNNSVLVVSSPSKLNPVNQKFSLLFNSETSDKEGSLISYQQDNKIFSKLTQVDNKMSFQSGVTPLLFSRETNYTQESLTSHQQNSKIDPKQIIVDDKKPSKVLAPPPIVPLLGEKTSRRCCTIL